MELYLIRHADAIALGERGVTCDDERPLSEKGESQSETLAHAFLRKGIALDKLYTSPLLRARQTAEVLLKAWSMPDSALETCDALAPGGKLRKLSKFLLKTGEDKVGLVGHSPHLEEFAAWLLGDKKSHLELAKSGAALVTCGDLPGKGHGALRWLLTPEWY